MTTDFNLLRSCLESERKHLIKQLRASVCKQVSSERELPLANGTRAL